MENKGCYVIKVSLKKFPGDKLKMTQMTKLVPISFGNIVENGENAGHQRFLPFPQYFQKPP